MGEVRRRICIAIGEFGNDVPIAEGVSAYSREHGPWEITTHQAAHVPVWFAASYDGLIAAGVYEVNVMDQLARHGQPIVGAHSALPANARVAAVTTDDAAIGRLAAEYLLSCGYRHFGFYGWDIGWSIRRYEGFHTAILRRRVTLATNAVEAAWPPWHIAVDETSYVAFLRSLPLPCAVFACDDTMAKRVTDSCLRMGLRVPEQIAVLGVNNMSVYCESSEPTISSIDPDLKQIGYEAAAMLDRMIQRGEQAAATVLVRPRRVVDRRSTNPTAFDDAEVAAALQQIRKEACSGIDVSAICDRLSISRRELERRFRQALGRSPGAEIRQVRIDRACELLAGTEMPISVVAINCGYEHSQSFSTAFRKVTEMTPRHYRVAHRPGGRPAKSTPDSAA